MSRTALAVQTIAPNGAAALTTVTPDAANGMYWPNTGHEELVVVNNDAASKTVTIHSVPCSHGRTGDMVLTVLAGAVEFVAPLDPAIWNQSDGTVYVDFSASTSVKVGVRRDH